jgi:DNA-directed RNA polymerase subunit beta
LKGKSKQGVKINYGEELLVKGTKFTQPVLKDIDFTTVDYGGWTDEKIIPMSLIARLFHNLYY